MAVNFRIEGIGRRKPEKDQWFKGIRTRDVRGSGSMVNQVTSEARDCERGRFV